METAAATLLRNAELVTALFERSPDAIILADADGKIVLANTQAETLSGYTRAQLRTMRVEDLLPEELRGRHVEHRSEYMDDARTRPMGLGLDLHLCRSSGKLVPVDINLASAPTAHGVYAIATIRRRKD